MKEIEEIKEFLGHIEPKVGVAAFAQIWATVELLENKVNQGQLLPIDGVSVALLKKYMNHVDDCEGIDFTGSIGERPSEQEFTDKEKSLLLKLSNDNSCGR